MITAVGVVIPARNEAELLPACVESVVAALRHVDMDGILCWCTVVLDGCRDESSVIASAAQHRHGLVSPVEIEAGNVGVARSRGMEEVLVRLSPHPAEQTWLAFTDADSVVPLTWLRDQVRLANEGSDVVAGIISVDNWLDRPATTSQRFAAHYRIEPDGSHEHVHGANLGFRASTYLAAGGVPTIPLGEDHALLDALARTGATVTRTSVIEVATSARKVARAEGGFSAFLTRLG